ncbi:Riboflavin biosynthesis protein RibD [Dyadobacter sp. CECT 9275]|uniref:Riboflavin biosynthesis protein RibD n=1 Tax=Dyadobacter helix TaxID=2822344 RepID=A0A916J7H9_9BACT|nr:bifunctional diaminohydroxyphosphoribosylaminopyrimidine deaminase/5-amino-6-(5-phosphoribosylamino)uracil reductase RibD [Dyadobacter sp. CECT 9275]CAG4988925.1 Riboflavin biosynthesis protein RibD [Dyadobacter sp. CECT 9275]
METDMQWMKRALQLAAYGRGSVSPNPMVGCVIVHEDKIIGEGWHRNYGGPHAEVRAIEDVVFKKNENLLTEATAYVTLEPCAHTGKTPPCADLLVSKKLKRVVVCNLDPNPLVAGKGIAKLKSAGIEVKTDVLSQEGIALNKRFFLAMQEGRPYVILKWAETADGYLGRADGGQVRISSALSGLLVHQWRAEEDSILVGFKTALMDNPKLNVRHWKGINPVRVVLDRNLQLPASLNLMDQSQPTLIINYLQQTELKNWPERYGEAREVSYARINPENEETGQILHRLFERKIHSVFVEGGVAVINSFLQAGLWDEIRRCQGTIQLGTGVKAPAPQGILRKSEMVEGDLWTYYSRY